MAATNTMERQKDPADRKMSCTMKNGKILFLHGFFASGACVPAQTLKAAFMGRADVMTPDLPLHPREAMDLIENICDSNAPMSW